MDFTKKITKKSLQQFVDFILEISDDIGFKVSSRGWGYILEQRGVINKNQFDKIENVINKCRKEGLLPVDFVGEEASRSFHEVHKPSDETLQEHIKGWLEAAMECDGYYEPNWWDGEEYYIQMVVEKIDLVTLFQPICKTYHVPIANSKGWSSILQRAEYCRRFKQAEENGLKCVLLYCGDHDPDGLRISETIRKNLNDIRDVHWSDGTRGFDADNLIIERFGLNYDFIIKNKLTWIDNLITGNTQRIMKLNDTAHPNHYLPYVQAYLKKVGVRKCEANALVVAPASGRKLCEQSIVKYLGTDAKARFKAKRDKVRGEIIDIMDDIGVKEPIINAIGLL